MNIRNLFRPTIKEYSIEINVFRKGVTWPEQIIFTIEAFKRSEAEDAALECNDLHDHNKFEVLKEKDGSLTVYELEPAVSQ